MRFRAARLAFLSADAVFWPAAWELPCLAQPTAAGVQAEPAVEVTSRPQAEQPALVAITLDLEMSRNFPVWEATEWDYEKGNLNAETKRYTVEVCRRVKAEAAWYTRSPSVGSASNQTSSGCDRLPRTAPRRQSHLRPCERQAMRLDGHQARFRRSRGWPRRTPADLIAENIRLWTIALKDRCGSTWLVFALPAAMPTGWPIGPTCRKCFSRKGSVGRAASIPNTRSERLANRPTAEVLAKHRGGAGRGPAVCLSVGTGRSADEPG